MSQRRTILWLGLVILVILGALIVGRWALFGSKAYQTEESPVPESLVTGFVLGLYDVPMEDLPTVKAAGFDLVHLYDSQQSLPHAMRYLAAAQGAGLRVIQNMPSKHLHDGREFWVNWVSTLAAYDNLAWWYLPEEPRSSDYEAMREIYEIVREYDPKGRPAAVYFGTTQLTQWCGITDILLVPAYPEYHQAPRADVRAWLDIAQESCPGKAVVSVQALFDANFNGTGDRPTPDEARTDAYTALISGSQGLLWYSYVRGKDLPALWPAVQGVTREIEALTPVITSPAIPQTIHTRVLSGPTHSPKVEGRTYDSILVLQKRHAEATYLLAVNLAEEPVTVRFEDLSDDGAEVTRLFDEHAMPVSNRTFRDEFAPAAVHVYKITE
jgi:hypothetical protein